MNIKRSAKASRFTTIDNSVIGDTNISPTSLGVLLYVLSKPDGWQARKSEIIKRFASASISFTKNALDNVFRELRAAGYIRIIPIKTINNGSVKFKGSEYVFYDLPQSSEVAISSEVGTSSGVGDFGSPEELPPNLVNTDYLSNTNFNKEREGDFLENFETEPNPGRENFERLYAQEVEIKKVAPKKESAEVLRERETSTDIDMTQLTFAPNMNPELVARARLWIAHKKDKNPKYRQTNAQAAIEDIYALCANLKKSFDGNLEKAQAFVCDAIRHAIAQDYQTIITDAKAVQQYKDRMAAPEPEQQPRKSFRNDKPKPPDGNNLGAQYSNENKYEKYK